MYAKASSRRQLNTSSRRHTLGKCLPHRESPPLDIAIGHTWKQRQRCNLVENAFGNREVPRLITEATLVIRHEVEWDKVNAGPNIRCAQAGDKLLPTMPWRLHLHGVQMPGRFNVR